MEAAAKFQLAGNLGVASVGPSKFSCHSRSYSSRRCISTSYQIPSHYGGLKSSVPGPLGGVRVDLNASLYETVQASMAAAVSGGSRQRRGEVTMMPIGTPRVPYKTPGEGGWQWVDIWNVLYRERIIFVGQHIDDEFGNQILATMLYLDSIESTKPMYLYLNSPGGEITPSMAIHDTMESIRSPVGTLALGSAYNMAGFLLLSGEKGLRTAMPLTRLALQSPAGAARGRAGDVENEAKELVRVRTYMYSVIAKKTDHSIEQVTKDLNRIKRFNAKEAVEYGMIDRITRPRRIQADASLRE